MLQEFIAVKQSNLSDRRLGHEVKYVRPGAAKANDSHPFFRQPLS